MIVPDFTAANYIKVMGDPYYLSVFLHTMVAAFALTLVSLLVAYPAAWVDRPAPRGGARSLMLWAVYLPIYVSVIMRVLRMARYSSPIAASSITRSSVWALFKRPVRMINEITGMSIGPGASLSAFHDPSFGDGLAEGR